ncbi:MAG: DUF3102 domain-containing protein [Ruminococcaceae bacterium]|nr:DUF3102 domain-containing protein [Oscillospiraceae bacterium]
MSNIVTARDIEMVTSDIHYAQRQGARQLLSNLIEIGRLLVEAKSMVPHGEWGKYLEERVNYSQSTANNYMKLYQEYGDNQESFFNSFSNSQAFGNLTYTQAIALLALPAEERQEFAENNDVAEMSTRQLEQAIRERNEERAARERAEELAEKAQQELLAQEKATAAEKDNVARLRDLQVKAKGEANAANEKVEKLQKQLEKAKANEKAAKEALAKAQENPEIPEAMMESLRQQVAAEAAREATEKLQAELDAANKAKETAERNAEQAEQKLVAAQKALQLSSPDAAVFKTLFEQVQENFKCMLEALENVQQADSETGEKLHKALRTLLSKLIDDLEGV